MVLMPLMKVCSRHSVALVLHSPVLALQLVWLTHTNVCHLATWCKLRSALIKWFASESSCNKWFIKQHFIPICSLCCPMTTYWWSGITHKAYCKCEECRCAQKGQWSAHTHQSDPSHKHLIIRSSIHPSSPCQRVAICHHLHSFSPSPSLSCPFTFIALIPVSCLLHTLPYHTRAISPRPARHSPHLPPPPPSHRCPQCPPPFQTVPIIQHPQSTSRSSSTRQSRACAPTWHTPRPPLRRVWTWHSAASCCRPSRRASPQAVMAWKVMSHCKQNKGRIPNLRVLD